MDHRANESEAHEDPTGCKGFASKAGKLATDGPTSDCCRVKLVAAAVKGQNS